MIFFKLFLVYVFIQIYKTFLKIEFVEFLNESLENNHHELNIFENNYHN